ncbi:MAG: DUF167 domain-containing protein [Gloeobacteraceae cyanobacterium ES-bin-144]|nr:DUF167 domain-containing protein [Verrucomicrobiales bacterium]
MNDSVLPPFARVTPMGLELRLKVVPGASCSAMAGVLGERLKVRIAAPAEGGKANRAVLSLLETWLKGTTITLIAGQTSAEKTVCVAGRSSLSSAELAAVLHPPRKSS